MALSKRENITMKIISKEIENDGSEQAGEGGGEESGEESGRQGQGGGGEILIMRIEMRMMRRGRRWMRIRMKKWGRMGGTKDTKAPRRR